MARRSTSFIGRFRDECLDQHWFATLAEARAVIEAWRQAYNAERPHSSLGYLTPTEYRVASVQDIQSVPA